jgi:NADPH-dependent curcumin reductase CurA
MSQMNQQWRLVARPDGELAAKHFTIVSAPMPQPGAGEVLVRTIYLLIPPAMRMWMNERDSYMPAQTLGEVMSGISLGMVEKSNHPGFVPGMYVNGMGGCQEWFVAPGEQLMPISAHAGVPLAAYRSVLDVQGLTAYCGLKDICRPVAGQTLVVTAAAGSVGSLVCQIGKKLGLKVVGIAGGPEKCAWLDRECGIDAVIDYKAGEVGQRLDALCPQGIDLVFENVGGPVFDLILDRINDHARIALCGLISSYNGGVTQKTSSLMQLVNKTATMEGFLVRDYFGRYAEVIQQLEAWVLDGSLKYQIEILDSLDSIVEAMARVFHGKNQGIQLVRLSPEAGLSLLHNET